LRIREIASERDPALRGAYRLLRRTFPPKELVPLSEMQNSLREREAGVLTDLRWHMLVAMRGDEVVGVGSGTYLGSLNVGTIGYLTVAPGERTGGLGARVRARLRKAFEQDALTIRGESLTALVGEVEADNPWLDYLVRRRGALALDLPYLQPEVRADREPVPLVLYYQPLRRSVKRLPVTTVRQLIFALWRRGYRIAAPMRDARFRRMLRALDGRRSVGQIHLPSARARRARAQ
jgi:hypothetical protein